MKIWFRSREPKERMPNFGALRFWTLCQPGSQGERDIPKPHAKPAGALPLLSHQRSCPCVEPACSAPRRSWFFKMAIGIWRGSSPSKAQWLLETDLKLLLKHSALPPGPQSRRIFPQAKPTSVHPPHALSFPGNTVFCVCGRWQVQERDRRRRTKLSAADPR